MQRLETSKSSPVFAVLDEESVRLLVLLCLVGCVDERGDVDVAATIDVSARDRASVEFHCFDATPCGDATLEVTIDGVATRITGGRGEVAMPPGAHELGVTWSDGVETVSAWTAIPEPVAIVEPVADAVVARPGALGVVWDVAHGECFETTTIASCDGIGRGITMRVAGSYPEPRSARIDLAYFDALPRHDCFATLAVAHLVPTTSIVGRTRLFLRTQDVDQIAYTLAYR